MENGGVGAAIMMEKQYRGNIARANSVSVYIVILHEKLHSEPCVKHIDFSGRLGRNGPRRAVSDITLENKGQALTPSGGGSGSLYLLMTFRYIWLQRRDLRLFFLYSAAIKVKAKPRIVQF